MTNLTEHWNGEGEHNLTFEVKVRSWGKLEKVVPDVEGTLNRILYLAFADRYELELVFPKEVLSQEGITEELRDEQSA